MRKLFLAASLAALGALMLVSGPAAAPHQSDKIHWEAMLFSQIVPLDPADAEGGRPSRPRDDG